MSPPPAPPRHGSETPHRSDARPAFEPFFFDRDALHTIAEARHEAYRSAQPFPHIVLDDFLPMDVAERLLAEFPEPQATEWIKRAGHGWHATPQQDASTEYRVLGKLECQDPMRLPPRTRQFLAEMNGGVFLEFLEKLTGIPKLLPDPHLGGGGLHSTGRGGKLRIHADFVWNERVHLDRRLNLLLYLNKGWTEANGGQLELWDREMKHPVKSILPVFNRCVIFTTSSTSFHGHPNPVEGSPDLRRRSMALYYYTNGRPEGEVESWHGEATLWQLTAEERSAEPSLLRRLTPPVLLDLGRYLRRELRPYKLVPEMFRPRRRD